MFLHNTLSELKRGFCSEGILFGGDFVRRGFCPGFVYHVTSRHVTSRHVTSRHVTSRHVTSRHVTSHHITSHHITSHHITSH